MKYLIPILVFLIGASACISNSERINDTNEMGSKNEATIIEYTPKSVDSILDLPKTEYALVLRTDFSSDETWKIICAMIENSGNMLGFRPYVVYLSDIQYEKLDKQKLLNRNENYPYSFIFLVDSFTINNYKHPILCVDLYDKPGEYFRVIPSEMWCVENNLSISNMGFEEFMMATDKNGIFRGY